MTPDNGYIDFHSHHPSREGETVIQDGVDTWGIHPWTLSVPSTQPDERLTAIGECGLDRLCPTPYEDQLEAFHRCIAESERLQKPLFLHCVRAIDDCLRLHSELAVSQPWIWHGFRGKASQLLQLLPHGFFFSFGFRFNEQALRACPADRLLLETDDDSRPVRLLYRQAADLRGVTDEELCRKMQENRIRLFPHTF